MNRVWVCISRIIFVKITANLFGLEFCKILKSHHKIAHHIYFVLKKKLFEKVFFLGKLVESVFCVSKMLISQEVMRCQY